ncbi:hypothetical protein [Paenibacillus tritici]|jgi:hypothetical protein|nr:hypothetical protein [Paenibacillus tritici]
MNHTENIMKVHETFNKSSEKTVNSIKRTKWNKLCFVLYPEGWTFFLKLPWAGNTEEVDGAGSFAVL